jgi:two-component system, OmpR family, sensor kinase
MSLRRRLTLTAALLVVAAVIGMPLAMWAVGKNVNEDRAGRQLETVERRLAPLLAGGRALPVPEGESAALFAAIGEAGGGPSFLQLRDASGRVLQTVAAGGSPPVPAEALPRPGGASLEQLDEDDAVGEWWIRGTWLPDGRMLLVALEDARRDRLAGMLTGFQLLFALAILGTLSTIAYRIIGRAVRPLEEITATARAIGAGDLAQRVPPGDPKTEAGQLGVAFNHMLGQIEESQERLRRFVADASHELRTPVAIIRGYAELFRRGAATRPGDLATAMTRIEAEASRMGVLVDELLLLARIDQGRPLEREPVELTALTAEAVEAAATVAPGRSWRLAIESPQPIEVVGDADRLRQVVDNLLANVRLHTPEGCGATVTLGLTPGLRDSRTAVLRVTDEGPGIAPQDVERVFERFYRAPSAPKGEGSGLGLSIVAAVVQAHGGSVSAEGSSFTVRLPIS